MGNDESNTVKQKTVNPDDSIETDALQPLIIKQAPKNPKAHSRCHIILVRYL